MTSTASSFVPDLLAGLQASARAACSAVVLMRRRNRSIVRRVTGKQKFYAVVLGLWFVEGIAMVSDGNVLGWLNIVGVPIVLAVFLHQRRRSESGLSN